MMGDRLLASSEMEKWLAEVSSDWKETLIGPATPCK